MDSQTVSPRSWKIILTIMFLFFAFCLLSGIGFIMSKAGK